MNYVKSFDLFGVPAIQIPATPGSGVPTTATEGAVGCLYMDTDTGNLYKCTAAVDSVYTWVEAGNGSGGGSSQSGDAIAIDYDRNVKSIAHRGYSHTAPENTIPAFILAKKNGFNYVEADIYFTSDGVPVLCHNMYIDATSDGSGRIDSFTYQELLQYDFGSWKSEAYAGTRIATFDEFIMTCKGLGLHPYIEIKQATQGQVEEIVDAVKRAGMRGNVTYITYQDYIKNVDPYARLGLLADNFDESILDRVSALKTEYNEVFIDTNYSTLTDEELELCISNKIPLELYTVNSEEIIRNMSGYVTGVTTDYIIAGKVLYEKYLTYTPPVITEVSATSITLSVSELSFTESVNQTITATVEPSNSTDVVVWNSSNTSVAKVTGGVVTPVGNGSCVITATAGAVSAECAVTVEMEESGGTDTPETGNGELLYDWDFTQSLVDTVSGNTVTLSDSGATQDASGLTISSATGYATIANTFASGLNRTIEIDVASVDRQGTAHGRFVTIRPTISGGFDSGFIYRNSGKWAVYCGGWFDSTVTDTTALNDKTITIKIYGMGTSTDTATFAVYLDGELLAESNNFVYTNTNLCIGSPLGNSLYNCTVTGMRVYSGV